MFFLDYYKASYDKLNTTTPRFLAKIAYELKIVNVLIFKSLFKMFLLGSIKKLAETKLMLNRIIILHT